jgi:hypothetical protein
LKGKAGIPGQEEGRPATPIALRAPPAGSLQQRDGRVQTTDGGIGVERSELCYGAAGRQGVSGGPAAPTGRIAE